MMKKLLPTALLSLLMVLPALVWADSPCMTNFPVAQGNQPGTGYCGCLEAQYTQSCLSDKHPPAECTKNIVFGYFAQAKNNQTLLQHICKQGCQDAQCITDCTNEVNRYMAWTGYSNLTSCYNYGK